MVFLRLAQSRFNLIFKNLQSPAKLSCNFYSTPSTQSWTENDTMKSYTNGKTSYATSVSKYSLVTETIKDLINRNAEENQSKLLYGFPHQRFNITFSEMKNRVDIAVQNLLHFGFVKGDRIAFLLPNTIELAVLFLAASEIGLISVILNPAYQQIELEYMLEKSGAKGVFLYDSFKTLNHLEIIKSICPEMELCAPGEMNSKRLPNLKHVVILNSPLIAEKKSYKGTWTINLFMEPNSKHLNYTLPYIEMDDPCLILFTSGTTGKPKGALINQSNVLNSAYLSTVVVDKPEGLTMICNPIPLFHIFGLATGLLIPLLMGTSIIFPFYFPDTLFSIKAIQGYKCVTMRATPTQFVDLLNHPEVKKHDLSSLQTLIVGGSTVPPELALRLKKELNIKSIIIGYGMTETSLCHSVVTVHDEKKSLKIAYESVGRTLPYAESKIIDQKTGQIQPLGETGELCVRGRHIISGYWDEPEKTAKTIDKNNWLHTGDLFSMDKDGYLYFKGRCKDIIIRGGANIYPAEIESYLCTHPSILDAHVFGVPDSRLQEEICVWVKLRPNTKLTENELKDFCKHKIANYKIPRFYKFVDNFPINANAKVLKNVMRESAIKELQL